MGRPVTNKHRIGEINVNKFAMHRCKYICCQNVTDAIYVKCLLKCKAT